MNDPLLQGYRVLDLTQARAGPSAARLLGDWGADVIKIEPLDRGDMGHRHGSDFQNLHRNKRSLCLNLKSQEGKALFLRLVATADVVIENYRADVKHRLGIDYETLKAVNPGIVYASISGFGQDGPYASRPGFDQIAQGMGGLMSITGLPGQGPVRAGIAVADLAAGLYCATGIVAALLERVRSGEGQWVTSSLLEAQIALLDFQATRWLVDGEVPGQAGNEHPTMVPTGVYRASDGHINIATAGDETWRRLCTSLRLDGLIEDSRFKTQEGRLQNRKEINSLIDDRTATHTVQSLVERLNRAGVPCGPIYSLDQVFDDPQVRHLGMTREVEHPVLGQLDLVAQPVRFSRSREPAFQPTPEKGEHGHQILSELGLSDDEISVLHGKGIA